MLLAVKRSDPVVINLRLSFDRAVMKRTITTVACVLALAVPAWVVAQGAGLTVFSSGDPVSASAINDNFSYLDGRITALEDGFSCDGFVPTNILAIAWIEKGGSAGFDAGTDEIISVLEDMNTNNIPDFGDRVTACKVPIKPDGSQEVDHAMQETMFDAETARCGSPEVIEIGNLNAGFTFERNGAFYERAEILTRSELEIEDILGSSLDPDSITSRIEDDGLLFETRNSVADDTFINVSIPFCP